jgi:glycosidase
MRNRLAAALVCLSLLAGAPALAWQAPRARAQAPDTSWVARSALYEIFVRDFSPTGDFRGVTRGLDHVQAVGANVLWLMPIYPVGVLNHKGTLGSPYAARDYRAINPAFGTAADLRELVQAVHARGMKIILDFVPNHTAWDNGWIREHPDWYLHNERGEISVPRDEQGRLTDWTDVAALDYRNPQLRRAVLDAMRYWLVEFGIDGFRVDVAGFVPDDFWREAVPALRAAAHRRILLLAEWGDPRMHRLGFDLTYGWDSYSRLKAVWRGAPASSFIRSEVVDMRAMPAGGMRMRFTTNHDESAWDNPPVTLFGGSAGARAAFVAIALLPGRPLLYNGQDIESAQKLRLFERDTIAWNQPGAAAAAAFYRRVLNLARSDPAFISADLREVETTVPDDVIAYARGTMVVLVNARSHAVRAAVAGVDVNGARDLLSGALQRGDAISLPAYGAMVLQLRGRAAPPRTRRP